MATTSDERREVAARLRRASACGEGISCCAVDRALGLRYDDDYFGDVFACESVRDLADLIDPTCENKYRNHGDRSFMCSECGYEAFTYGDSNCDPDDFAFCPHCGARVTRGGDE